MSKWINTVPDDVDYDEYDEDDFYLDDEDEDWALPSVWDDPYEDEDEDDE